MRTQFLATLLVLSACTSNAARNPNADQAPLCTDETCVGEQGEKGEKGDKGDPGVAGPQGPQGIQGPQGLPGVQGPKGDRGNDGAPGSTGAQGMQGPQGIQGPAGQKGDTGSQGLKGDQGIQGPKGDTGAQGPAGPKGDNTPHFVTNDGRTGYVVPTNYKVGLLVKTIGATPPANSPEGWTIETTQLELYYSDPGCTGVAFARIYDSGSTIGMNGNQIVDRLIDKTLYWSKKTGDVLLVPDPAYMGAPGVPPGGGHSYSSLYDANGCRNVTGQGQVIKMIDSGYTFPMSTAFPLTMAL